MKKIATALIAATATVLALANPAAPASPAATPQAASAPSVTVRFAVPASEAGVLVPVRMACRPMALPESS